MRKNKSAPRRKASEGSALEGSRTLAHLREAFSAEALLAFRYLYCARLAEFEGLDRQAEAFRELAAGGTTSVHGCLDFLKLARDPATGLAMGATAKNLEVLLQSEGSLAGRDYPDMAAAARREGFHDVASWFDTLEKLKRSHARRLRKISRG